MSEDFHIELNPEDIKAYQRMHEAGKLAAMGSEIERTRSVRTHDHQDLLGQLCLLLA